MPQYYCSPVLSRCRGLLLTFVFYSLKIAVGVAGFCFKTYISVSERIRCLVSVSWDNYSLSYSPQVERYKSVNLNPGGSNVLLYMYTNIMVD